MQVSGETMIKLTDIVKMYGKIIAVDGVSLEIRRGEFVVIMGPSGCGKTTTLRMIAGLETPDSGEIVIDGKRVNEAKPWQRDVPLVWQNFVLFPHLTVSQNVEYGLRMRNIPKKERMQRVARILHTVGLEGLEDRSVVRLSGGQKQRVGLARALVVDPKVLLLDEPLGALDAKIARSMQQELRRLHSMLGITFVYVTHNQSEAMALANRIVVMNEGKIRQVGTPNQIFRTPSNRFVAEFVGANNIFTGTIKTKNNSDLTISTPEGDFVVATSGRDWKPKEEATFVVGADLVTIGKGHAEAENRLVGRTSAVEIMGSVVTLYVVTATGSEFQAQVSATSFEREKIEVDQSVQLSWKKEDAYLLLEK